MEAKSAMKVGAVSIIALIVFGAFYMYLAHLNPNTYRVRVMFNDTQGLVAQSVVRMRGVAVGEVTSIDLDMTKRPPVPVVILSIKDRYAIPRNSRFVIISGILITNPQVQIQPGDAMASLPQNGAAVVVGAPPVSPLSALSPELEETVTKVNSAFDSLNGRLSKAYAKIDRIMDQTQMLLTTSNQAIKSANSLVSDPKLRMDLLDSADNLHAVTVDARVMTRKLGVELHKIVTGSGGKFDKLSDNLLDLITRIGGTVDQANTVVTRLTEQVTDPRLQQSLQETAELARTTLARFNQIASDIHQLTGDPALQGNVRASVQNLQVLTARGQEVVKKVNDILGPFAGSSGKNARGRLQVPQVHFVANLSEQIDPGRFRVDVNARFGSPKKGIFDLGLYDLGQNTRLTLEVGNHIAPNTRLRYGIYASKLAGGLDWEPSPGSGIQLDLWDTNHPRLDFKGLFRVNNDASVWVGADALLLHPVALLGVQIKH